MQSSPTRAPQIALALVVGGIESHVTKDTWRNPTGIAAAYSVQLVEWGYAASEVEQIVLDAATEKSAEFSAAEPAQELTSEGVPITSFRLASTQRRFDTSTEKRIDGETNWYTVTAFRQLAAHTAESLDKSDRILVVGKLRIREWENDERTGTTIGVEAQAIGHDLAWGTGVFTRTPGAGRGK